MSTLIPRRFRPYAKTVAAVVIGALGWAGMVIASPEAAISATEWLALGTGTATAAGVYALANEE